MVIDNKCLADVLEFIKSHCDDDGKVNEGSIVHFFVTIHHSYTETEIRFNVRELVKKKIIRDLIVNHPNGILYYNMK